MKSFIIVNFKDYQIKLPVNDEQAAAGRTKLENLFMRHKKNGLTNSQTAFSD
jgi:hypothetical protein